MNPYINLKEREPDGIVDTGEEYELLRDAIISRLMDLEDPITQEKVVKKVYRREEIYDGLYMSKAADLIVQWSDAGYHSVQRFGKAEDSVFGEQLKFHLTNMRFTGYHRMEGIFAIEGKNIKHKALTKEARIIDIAPTVLYLMGMPVPRDMDGRVLEEVFIPAYLAKNPVQFEEVSEQVGDTSGNFGGYKLDETNKIAERLRNLGYID